MTFYSDYSDKKSIVKRQICTEIVYKDPLTGCTRREVRMQMEVKNAPGLPVLAADHERNLLPVFNNAFFKKGKDACKPEPLRDPRLNYPNL